jgi:hypothetical protein
VGDLNIRASGREEKIQACARAGLARHNNFLADLGLRPMPACELCAQLACFVHSSGEKASDKLAQLPPQRSAGLFVGRHECVSACVIDSSERRR